MTPNPSPIAFNACALFSGSAGVMRFAASAADALLDGPLASRVRLHAPTCRRADVPARFRSAAAFYPAPDPRRGTVFNNLFWTNCLSLHLRVRHPGATFYSPVETHAVLPLPRPVLTVHDCYADRWGDPRRQGRPSLGRRLSLRQMRRSRLLPVSRFTARELGELHGLAGPRVHPVPNWLPRDFDPRPDGERLERVRAALGLPPRFWLYVGGFRLNKNLPFLIEAYAAAARVRPLPPLVIAGRMPAADTPFSGPIHAALAAHPGLADRLLRPGFVPDADLPALYKLASLVVCPSFYEGFGYPVIEAAAVGTPLLAARAASYPELVGENSASLFALEDPAELVARLLLAADDERRFSVPLASEYLPDAGEARFNAAFAGA